MEINNNTLNKDINLIERDCGYWDYDFQYGDIVHTKNKESLRTGLIIACLTSWNYLNRQENPTYSEFGNKAYLELKKKKSSMVEYTIKQYFLEVLNRIRRVNRVIDLQVLNTKNDPNAYDVAFIVEAINDEIVNGRFNITTDYGLSTTYFTIEQLSNVATPNRPSQFNIIINTEYGNILNDELIYAYRILEDGNEQFIGAYYNNKPVPITALPNFNKEKVKFKFNGNKLFNGCESDNYEILSIPFYFTIDENEDLQMIKHPDTTVKAWLGTITDDIEKITDPAIIYLLSDGEGDYYKYYYSDGEWKHDSDKVYALINKPTDLKNEDIRLFIEDLNGELTVISKVHMENNHIYYDL